MKKILLLSSLLSSVIATNLEAKIILPDILSDNMVLQQNTNVRLWGKSDKNKEIQVSPSWDKNIYKTRANQEGKWLIEIPTPKASYIQHSITFSDGEKIKLKNILIGEVWFASGQSNMEMPLNGFWNCPVEGSNETIATSES